MSGRLSVRHVVCFLGICISALLCLAPASRAENRDACTRDGGWCECSNTKRAGVCGGAPNDLYCHCDKPVTQNDGCQQESQTCTCGNTGKKGACALGPAKEGMYCHCP